MLKGLAILAVVLVVGQSSVPASGEAPDHNASHSQNLANQSTASKKKKTPASPVSPTIDSASFANQTKPNKTSDDPKPVTVSKLPTISIEVGWRDNLALIFTGFLVFIGGFGVYYAKVTLDSIADQAKSLHEHAGHFDKLAAATQRQADIEEAHLSQWVEAEFFGITTYELTKVPNSNAIQTAEIALRGRVVNPTALPLTIKKIVVEICVKEPVWKTYEHTVDEFLAPSQKAEGAYPFSVRLTLDGQGTAELIRKQFLCAAAIHVYFVEAASKDRDQTFRSFLTCSMHNLASDPFRGDELHPTKQQQKTENPN